MPANGVGPLRRRIVRWIAIFALMACMTYYFGFPGSTTQPSRSPSDDTESASLSQQPKPGIPRRTALVVARLLKEDTSWYYHYFPSHEKYIYVMDDPTANLTVLRNKGRESSAYLTFLIDHYQDLPDHMLFLHALRYQWHNEDPMYDGVPPIQNLNLDYVDEEGYVNMRCTWVLGCPAEIHPAGHSVKTDGVEETNQAYPEVMKILLPEVEVPEAVGVHCGAQFALSKAKVLERPRSDYIKIRDWLWSTDLPDNVSGRVLEYMWHMIFGKPAVHCPRAEECFCKKYGHCNLTCNSESSCEKRFQLPMYANLPAEWPEVGPGTLGWPAKDWWL